MTKLSTPDGRAVPDKWAQRGAVTTFNPPPLERTRQLWLSKPGRGKTETSLQIPGAIHLDYDLSSSLLHRKASSISIPMVDKPGERVWDLHRAVVGDLIQDRARDYQTVVLDTLDMLWEVLSAKAIHKWNTTNDDILKGKKPPVTSLQGIKDKGSSIADVRDTIIQDIHNLGRAGYGVVMLGHLHLETRESFGETTTEWVPTLNKKLCGNITGHCDLVLEFTKTRRPRMAPHPVTGKLQETKEFDPVFMMDFTCVQGEMDTKLRLQLAELRLEFPQYQGWSVLKEAYDTAVTQARA